MENTTAIITDRDIRRAAAIAAAGWPVQAVKLSCSPRCAFQYPDTPETRKLSRQYEAGQVLQVAHKAVMQAHGRLLSDCHDLKSGRIGGLS